MTSGRMTIAAPVLSTPAGPTQGTSGLVGSSSTRGGTPPFLSPYFAAKAAMDRLAVSYASKLAR